MSVGDFDKARQLANEIDVTSLHKMLDEAAAKYCPVSESFNAGFHWSISRAEYSTDVVFHRREELTPLFNGLVRSAVQAAGAQQVAMFLGRKVMANGDAEIGSDLARRGEGMRVKHFVGRTSVKMYSKFGRVLRIETTTNDVSSFNHYREVVQRDGLRRLKLAPVKKTIYSLQPDLRELMAAANTRYLPFFADLDDRSAGTKALEKVAEPAKDKGRSCRGLNFFAAADAGLIAALVRGEHTITGFRAKELRRHLPKMSSSQMSHCRKRLRLHGLVKRIARTYKYYLTKLGESVLLSGLKLKELVLIPERAWRVG